MRFLYAVLLLTSTPAAAQIEQRPQKSSSEAPEDGTGQRKTTSWAPMPQKQNQNASAASDQAGQWSNATVSRQVEQKITSGPAVPRGYNIIGGPCEIAITNAEKQYNLPPYILHAIAVTESGRNGRPYPFAMNIKGRTHYAANSDEMVNIINRYGARSSIDVGCVQVNLRYHGHRLGDWRRLIEPTTNAQYAAFHLVELFREFGSWSAAVAAYHSRTQWRGVNYACLVSRNYGQILGDYRQGCGPSIEHLTAYLYRNVRR